MLISLLFTHMVCRIQSVSQQDRDPSQLHHHPPLYPANGHMGSASSDPVKGHQCRSSPRTNQMNPLIQKKKVNFFCTVQCLCIWLLCLFLDSTFFPHLSCRARFELLPGLPDPRPPQWTHWSSPVQTYSCSFYKPLDWWSLWVTCRFFKNSDI